MSSPETPCCVRCKDPLVMGHAYELGNDRWHTHCFSCYKCEKPLSCDSNFLVLGTGALICFACSDSCKKCGKKIDDLAIILASSNEAYCSDCFKCCKCGEKIEDLRYAKTKRGLFCITCHERLLEKRKNYEERKRRLKKELPRIPTDESLSYILKSQELVVPERSANRPMSPMKSTDPMGSPSFDLFAENTVAAEDAAPIDMASAEGDSPIESSSEKLIQPTSSSSAHFLTAPVDFSANTSTAGGSILNGSDKSQEAHGNEYQENIQSNSESVVAQFLLDTDYTSTGDEQTPVKKSPKKHQSQMSIDDMLQSTLENDQVESPMSSQNGLKPPQETKKELLNKTPLRNSTEDSFHKSPVAHRRGLVLNDFEVMDALNSPVKVQPIAENDKDAGSIGLGISNSKEIKEEDEEDKVLGIPYESVSQAEVNTPSNTNLVRSPSIFGHHRRTSSGNKKLTRSLSKRSKNLMMNLRSKSKDSKSSISSKANDSDTHSGWGVSSSTSQPSTVQRRTSNKHQSDSTIYSHPPHEGRETPADHKRSHSGASSVAVYRTPPLDTKSSFNKGSSVHEKNMSFSSTAQIEERDEEDDKTPTNTDFIDKDIIHLELTLRRLKLEVNQLQATKAQLSSEIDNLNHVKNGLLQDIEVLKVEKKTSSTNSVESLEPDPSDESPVRQATASVGTTAKPKFWKLFSGGRGNLSNGSSNGKFEISSPVLQNPSEFEDLKLLPVLNDKKSAQSATSNSTSMDGTSLYGSTLVARCSYEGNKIPTIVTTCIEHIESKEEYLMTEGLYRKSGSQVLIEQIEGLFSDLSPGEQISKELQSHLDQDIHAVSGVLKRYLRRLPNPVFTFQIYEPLINLVRDRNLISTVSLGSNLDRQNPNYTKALDKFIEILQSLPEEHYFLLSKLVKHVNEVARYSESNLMNLHNLSLVFAPGLIRDYSGEKDIVDMKERNYIISFIFSRHRDIFD